MKTFLWFGAGLAAAIIALMIFFRGLDIKALLFLIFGVSSVFLIRQGIISSRKK